MADKRKVPPSYAGMQAKKDAFKKYKKKMGLPDEVEIHHLDPSHPMNTESTEYRSQGGKMGAEAVYAKIGCKVYNNR